MSHHKAVPVGGPLMTRGPRVLLFVFMVAVAIIIWRFAVGLGASTGLNDGYPWGIWIAFDVVTGTALACGGYAVALLVYILNKGKYHPLVRPAILTSALGYTVAALAIVIDVGRPWLLWKIPISFGKWNLDSALLEVALCVMAYVVVLWIELSPAWLEKWETDGKGGRADFARKVLPGFEKALPLIIALGLLLPTMHQSSLGTVMMLAGSRLHELWHTPWLPFHFLISCIAMGYAVVVMESTLSSRVFGRRREGRMLGSLSKAIIVVLAIYVVARLVDIVLRGRAGLMFDGSGRSILFWLEIALFVVPAIMLATRGGTAKPGTLFRAAVLIVFGGSLYRFDAYLVAFQPSPGWSYFPSIPELFVTVGLVAFEVLAYILLVKSLPILGGLSPAQSGRE